MDELVQAMGMTGISKSEVSRLCKELDERANALSLDGETPTALVVATGIRKTGERRDLGCDIGLN